MKIYVATSWRNGMQPQVVDGLRQSGYEVYDFRNPPSGDPGFHWSEIDANWRYWSPADSILALHHPTVERVFAADWEGMQWAEAGVLVMPCGRSAHLEAGYFIGVGKPLLILLSAGEPELMYKMATGVYVGLERVLDKLEAMEATP